MSTIKWARQEGPTGGDTESWAIIKACYGLSSILLLLSYSYYS